MKQLNLIEILKDCPKGTKLYSPLFGTAVFDEIDDNSITVITSSNVHTRFLADGRYFKTEPEGECLLFPSKDCRDWSQFKQSQRKFKKGDRVVRLNARGVYVIGFFDRYTEENRGTVDFYLGGLSILSADVDIKELRKAYKFDPKWLKAGDAVLVRDYTDSQWYYSLFSHCSKAGNKTNPTCFALGGPWKYVIPYNPETKDLVGTTDNAPEFYVI